MRLGIGSAHDDDPHAVAAEGTAAQALSPLQDAGQVISIAAMPAEEALGTMAGDHGKDMR
ncbi:hypothetical protein ACWGQL_34705 [Streptomyces lydicus]